MAILNSKHGKIIMTITLHHTGSFRSLKYTRILSIVWNHPYFNHSNDFSHWKLKHVHSNTVHHPIVCIIHLTILKCVKNLVHVMFSTKNSSHLASDAVSFVLYITRSVTTNYFVKRQVETGDVMLFTIYNKSYSLFRVRAYSRSCLYSAISKFPTMLDSVFIYFHMFIFWDAYHAIHIFQKHFDHWNDILCGGAFGDGWKGDERMDDVFAEFDGVGQGPSFHRRGSRCEWHASFVFRRWFKVRDVDVGFGINVIPFLGRRMSCGEDCIEDCGSWRRR